MECYSCGKDTLVRPDYRGRDGQTSRYPSCLDCFWLIDKDYFAQAHETREKQIKEGESKMENYTGEEDGSFDLDKLTKNQVEGQNVTVPETNSVVEVKGDGGANYLLSTKTINRMLSDYIMEIDGAFLVVDEEASENAKEAEGM